MPEKRKYISILDLELESLEEDIGLLIDDHKRRKEQGEITNYVLLENLALLQSQMNGIASFRHLLASIDPESYSDLNSLVRDIHSRIKAVMDKSSFPESLYPLVLRRLAKVARYVKTI